MVLSIASKVASLTLSAPSASLRGGEAACTKRLKVTPSAGELKVARPLLIDWRKTSYTLGTTVSDGTNTSSATPVTVVIPKRVDMCLLDVIQLEVPKGTAPLVFLLGGDLGSCFKPL